MRAGRLNRRIQIQQQSTAQDSYGQQLESWTTVLQCWAAIRTATGKQMFAASGRVSQLSHVITIRRPDLVVRSSMRVQYGGRTWSVQDVSNPDEANRQLDLLCLELNEGL